MKISDGTIDRQTLRKIQKSQYYILKEFREFCVKHELRFTLDFGSILGAVRHEGFIPWDDDIDVAMLRDEYDRFLELAKAWNHDDIFIQNYKTDPEFVHSFTRLRLNGTLAIQEDWQNLKVHHGIFIDIFPYDTVAGDEILSKAHADEIRKIQEIKLEIVYSNTATPDVMSALNAEQTEIITRYNKGFSDEDVVSHMTQGLQTYYNSRRSADNFFNCFDCLFEQDLFPVPKNYRIILRNMYDKYMVFPLKEDRIPHHGVIELQFRDDILDLFED